MLLCRDRNDPRLGCSTLNGDRERTCRHCGRPLQHAIQVQNVNATVGNYKILGVVGAGGFGAVYQAQHLRDRRLVALKENFAAEDNRYLEKEVHELRRLKHAHLPRYYEFFMYRNSGYMVMEFIPGHSLYEVLKQMAVPFSTTRTLNYVWQLTRILHYLHHRPDPIIHRDIKPHNIRLMPDNTIKLVDFGLMKRGNAATSLAQTGLGSPAYMPIEQFGNTAWNTDVRSDIYSVGATMYHLLTNRFPIPADQRALGGRDFLEPPRKLVPTLSTELNAVIMKAMAYAPEDRYRSIDDFIRALRRVPEVRQAPKEGGQAAPRSEPISVEVPTANEGREQSGRTNNLPGIGVAAAVMVGILLIVGLLILS